MKRSKKYILTGLLTPPAALVLAFLILIFVTMGMYSPAYLGRVLFHWDSSASDYKLFPARTVEKSGHPYTYEENKDTSLDFSAFVKKTKTTSFLIAKDDALVYEEYANGYDAASVNTSFSMAKSVVSLLIGRTIEDGYIKSAAQEISEYLPEFENLPIGAVTIEDLLLMRSGIEYNEDKFLWFGDDSLTYFHTDLRALALSHTRLTQKYEGKFHYNNYHPLLLGMILERSTGVSVSEYFGREIWQKIGAEHDASWSLDSKSSGFEKMESGINFRAVDFLKIGSMVLHNGYWNGTQIISGNWLKASTLCSSIDGAEYAGSFLEGKNIGYRYMWYSMPNGSEYDIFAWGKSDQILYISPVNNVVVLRTGKTDGGVENWPEVLKDLANRV